MGWVCAGMWSNSCRGVNRLTGGVLGQSRIEIKAWLRFGGATVACFYKWLLLLCSTWMALFHFDVIR